MAHSQMNSYEQSRPPGRMSSLSSFGTGTRSEESWIDIASQPSSSIMADATHGTSRPNRRRRTLRPNETPALHMLRKQGSVESTSSQEEYDESESESDRIMTSSGEGLDHAIPSAPQSTASDSPTSADSDENENLTAINHRINPEPYFTPQPNVFSHPPAQMRSASQPTPGSYFPTINRLQSLGDQSHLRQSTGSNHKATVQHDEALRASLSTLLSCAAAARSHKDSRHLQLTTPRSNRIEPISLRLVPESALPTSSPPTHIQEPIFRPTLRRASTTTRSSSNDRREVKARSRPSSKERRAVKRARLTASEDLAVSPTLLTWVVSAGVVVVLSALSFSAGYNIGREAGKLDAVVSVDAGNGIVSNCAREATRSGLGLKRTLARSAVAV